MNLQLIDHTYASAVSPKAFLKWLDAVPLNTNARLTIEFNRTGGKEIYTVVEVRKGEDRIFVSPIPEQPTKRLVCEMTLKEFYKAWSREVTKQHPRHKADLVLQSICNSSGISKLVEPWDESHFARLNISFWPGYKLISSPKPKK
jgi:hypothetical protein